MCNIFDFVAIFEYKEGFFYMEDRFIIHKQTLAQWILFDMYSRPLQTPNQIPSINTFLLPFSQT